MKKGALILLVLVLVAAVAFFIFRPGDSGVKQLRGQKNFNVILITVDTLRADRLGCYGFVPDVTPAMNKMAAAGVRFENCIAQTPLTLPSHATILTGTLPIHHGVRDNGGFVVPPQLETMAEAFKSAGYQTAAFVSAYVLDSKWGLNQGFDYYFDRFDLGRFEKISLGEVQRRAEETIDEALAWLEKNKSGKFFAWIHLYDPHTPYEPPNPSSPDSPTAPTLEKSPIPTASSPASGATWKKKSYSITCSWCWLLTMARAWENMERPPTASLFTRKPSTFR